MSLVYVVTAAVIAISGVLVALSLAAASRKALRAAGERRQTRIEAAVRPLLLAFLAEDDPDPDALGRRSRAGSRSLAGRAAGVLTKLRGEDRRALAGVLQASGEIDRARQRTRSAGAGRRARAAELLGAAGVGEALPELTKLLHDRDPDVRVTAARALGKLGRAEAVPNLLAALDSRRSVSSGVVSMALLHLGPGAEATLQEGLSADNSPLARSTAAELLGRLGALDAANHLIDALRADPAPDVRAAAARALGRSGAPRAAVPLQQALMDDASPAVRHATAWALGELGGSRGFGALAVALGSGDHELARRAAHSLVSCGPSGLGLLQRVAAGTVAGASEARETLGRVAAAATR